MEGLEEGNELYAFNTNTYIRRMSMETALAVRAEKGKKEKNLKETLPPHYLEY